MSESALIVTGVGSVGGVRAVAAATACAASDADRAALLVDLSGERRPRPSLVSTVAARDLEERLAAHLPDAGVASRGRICHLSLSAELDSLGQVPAALATVRDTLGVLLLPAHLLQPALEEVSLRPCGAILRADLVRDRALVALAAADLIRRDVEVAVLKRPLSWVDARRALSGALATAEPLRQSACGRLLAACGDEWGLAER